jgi:CPA1 family monovalent cation:H+ antiporter
MRARLQSSAIWSTLDFILNGLVFILIGLQLPHILSRIKYQRLSTLLLDAALLVAVLIALRLIWVFAESWISQAIGKLLKRLQLPVPSRESFIVGWTGMRGMISLAAAISLPELLDDGTAFPERNVLIFLTFSVILFTLVAQGLNLPFLIRKLGLATKVGANGEERQARRHMLLAAITELHNLSKAAVSENSELLVDLLHHYQDRLDEANIDSPQNWLRRQPTINTAHWKIACVH